LVRAQLALDLICLVLKARFNRQAVGFTDKVIPSWYILCHPTESSECPHEKNSMEWSNMWNFIYAVIFQFQNAPRVFIVSVLDVGSRKGF